MMGICGICHDPVEDGIGAACGHAFCRICVSEYLGASDGTTTCPTCNRPLCIDLRAPATNGVLPVLRPLCTAYHRSYSSFTQCLRPRPLYTLQNCIVYARLKVNDFWLLLDSGGGGVHATVVSGGPVFTTSQRRYAGYTADATASPGKENQAAPAPAGSMVMPKFKKRSILSRINMASFQSSTKLEALREEIHNMLSHDPSAKCIVFSQFTSMLDLVQYRLSQVCMLPGCTALLSLILRYPHHCTDTLHCLYLWSYAPLCGCWPCGERCTRRFAVPVQLRTQRCSRDGLAAGGCQMREDGGKHVAGRAK